MLAERAVESQDRSTIRTRVLAELLTLDYIKHPKV